MWHCGYVLDVWLCGNDTGDLYEVITQVVMWKLYMWLCNNDTGGYVLMTHVVMY